VEHYPISLRLIEDNNTITTSGGYYSVRVVNLAVGLPNLTIVNYTSSSYSNNVTTLFNESSYGKVTAYKNVTGGSYVKAFLGSTTLNVFGGVSVGYSSSYYRGVVTVWITGQFAVPSATLYAFATTDASYYGYSMSRETRSIESTDAKSKKTLKRKRML